MVVPEIQSDLSSNSQKILFWTHGMGCISGDSTSNLAYQHLCIPTSTNLNLANDPSKNFPCQFLKVTQCIFDAIKIFAID